MLKKRFTLIAVTLAAGGALAASVAAFADGHRGHGMRGGPGFMGGFHMFQEFDTNGDGAVTAKEAEAVRAKSLAKFDGDKSGTLTLAEYEELWLEKMRPRMVDHFQRLDHDGDGIVTEAEMQRPISRRIARMDRNNDGKVTRDELRKGRHGKGKRHRFKRGGCDEGAPKQDK